MIGRRAITVVSSLVLVLIWAVAEIANTSPCLADTTFNMPETISKTDRVTVYKMQIATEYSLKHGRLFHNYLVTESKQLEYGAASNLFKLFRHAFQSEGYEPGSRNVMPPCLFVPAIGVSFEVGTEKIDATVSFDCSRICFFNGGVPVRNASLLEIRGSLLKALRQIFPKDEEIQSLE